jgi:hypothetical protein
MIVLGARPLNEIELNAVRVLREKGTDSHTIYFVK